MWQRGKGTWWGSFDSILGGHVCTGVFGEGILEDVASAFCTHCLLGVCTMWLLGGFVV